MDPAQVIEELGVAGRLPVEAIRAAQADRETMVPVFLRTIDDFLELRGPVDPNALFFMFHLLGEWREKSAYWPLAVFLRLPPDVLDDPRRCITETSHRVMAAFSMAIPSRSTRSFGILKPTSSFAPRCADDRHADAAWRAAARRDGGLPARLLFATRAAEDCYVWSGWIDAVAWLGLTELKPLVQQAFSASRSIRMAHIQGFRRGPAIFGRPSEAEPLNLTAISLCSAIRRELSGWDGSTEDAATKHPIGNRILGTPIAIPCATSDATIPVPAAAEKNSRNAA